MFGAFLIAAIAGFAAPHLQERIEKGVESLLLDKIDFAPNQGLALSFIACMLVAAILIQLSGAAAPPFVVILGGAVGFFGKQIYALIMQQVNK